MEVHRGVALLWMLQGKKSACIPNQQLSEPVFVLEFDGSMVGGTEGHSTI
jgi:hypothetical protein